MSVQYNTVVPWGRSFDEYLSMFALTADDLKKNILGCGDGPAEFNAVLTQKGGSVVSLDPIYQFTKEELSRRIEETYGAVMEQTEDNKEKFVWDKIVSVEALGVLRLEAMNRFLEDFENGKAEKRYIAAELPEIPKLTQRFDIALSSHFLFLYTELLSWEFHERSIDAILNVADEVRIFPLLDLNNLRSPYVDRIIQKYTEQGYTVAEKVVDYEFQKNGNRMLQIKK